MKRTLPIALVLAACSSTSKPHHAQPPPAANFEVVALKYAVADDVARLLSDLTESPDRRCVMPCPPSQCPPSIRVMSDPRTNSLVVQAGESDMPRIRELIAKLDVQVK